MTPLKIWVRKAASVSGRAWTWIGGRFVRSRITLSASRPIDRMWSRCEWLIRMCWTRASASSGMSPTPVPASIRTSSSRRKEVVLQPAAMEPEQPSTWTIMSCRRWGAVAARRQRRFGAKDGLGMFSRGGGAHKRPMPHLRPWREASPSPRPKDVTFVTAFALKPLRRPARTASACPASSITSPFFRLTVSPTSGALLTVGRDDAFDMGQNVAGRPLGDRRHLDAGLADGRDDLGQHDLRARPPRRS